MPYIAQADRTYVRHHGPRNPGELNYIITEMLRVYLDTNGTSYATINDCLGAIEGAKQEFYRRIAAPYEDKKIAENGDVYS